MTKINNGGTAFPATHYDPVREQMPDRESTTGTKWVNGVRPVDYPGSMSLRDWFAGQALAGMCAANPPLADSKASDEENLILLGISAYLIADTMLKARETATP